MALNCVFHKCSEPECMNARWHDRNSIYCHDCHPRHVTKLCPAHTCQNDNCGRECYANEEYCRQCAVAVSSAPYQEQQQHDVPSSPATVVYDIYSASGALASDE